MLLYTCVYWTCTIIVAALHTCPRWSLNTTYMHTCKNATQLVLQVAICTIHPSIYPYVHTSILYIQMLFRPTYIISQLLQHAVTYVYAAVLYIPSLCQKNMLLSGSAFTCDMKWGKQAYFTLMYMNVQGNGKLYSV